MAKKSAAKARKKAVKKASRKPAIGEIVGPAPRKSAPGKKLAVKKSHRFQ
jgi:hypothetical protein